MFPEKEWNAVRGSHPGITITAGVGILRLTLLFGSAVLALALVITPMVARHTGSTMGPWSMAAGIDTSATGSIGYSGNYILRRSVLQGSPSSICVIRDNGTRSGEC